MMIGEICRQAGCTPRTVRHYEAEGLIESVSITPGGRKLYGDETLSIIRMVQILRRLGYALKDIRKIILLTKSQHTKNRRLPSRLRGILAETLPRIDIEIDLLAASRKSIANLIKETEKCQSCTSPDCHACGKLKRLRSLGMMGEGNRPNP